MRLIVIVIYLFIFMPVAVVMLLAFNADPLGSFPIQKLSLRWFAALIHNHHVIDALTTSLLLATLTALIATLLGIVGALAIERCYFPGKSLISVALTAPVLVPEVILAVALLLMLSFFDLSTSFWLLLAGHVALSLPFTFLILRARLVAMKHDYEEAAMTLGANAAQVFLRVTLPLISPAVIVSALFAFALSFDNITGTLFWKPGGLETLPTYVLAMLRYSMSPEINALASAMIVITILLPLLAVTLVRRFFSDAL